MRRTAIVGAIALIVGCFAATPSAQAAGAPYSCGPAGNNKIAGTFGDASLIGWQGDKDGVVACLGGSYYVRDGKNTTYGFGIYDNAATKWTNSGGYLPALVTSFHRYGATISITNFGDKVTIGGHDFVVVYSRVTVKNPTSKAISVDPAPAAGMIALNDAPLSVPAGNTVNHDYAVAADRFGGTYSWPSTADIQQAGTYDKHFAHMAAYWKQRLTDIAEFTSLPDPRLVNAYKSGFIYTQIIRDGDELTTGENNYDQEFSHDVIGILSNLFTQGDFTDSHALLLRARYVIGSQRQYDDGVWKYSWPWAEYLLKTGDLAFVKANFATEGPQGADTPSIKDTAHQIAADRTGPGGIMKMTNDIDANGYWTIDDYSALFGLAAYRYIAQRVGDSAEAAWALKEYNALLAATNKTLNATISKYQLNYLPCSLIEPNDDNRCSNAEDANWAAPFLFGRWAWDGSLFGANINGPGKSLIDATYSYGFDRLNGKLPADTFGGYSPDFYSTGYNAGYGSWGLASRHHRAQGIDSYEFMIDNDQSGPYSFFESSAFPNTGSPWQGVHPSDGNGSSPHAWGIANANKVLLDSVAAQRSDGTLLIGTGIPNSWLHSKKPIVLKNFPTTNGQRVSIRLRFSGQHVAATVRGFTGKAVLNIPGVPGTVRVVS